MKKKANAARVSKQDSSNKPYISNYPPLDAWLQKHDARCLWQLPREFPRVEGVYDEVPSAFVECWMIRTQIVIILVHSNKMGWELFISANTTNIAVTFEDAEKRLGITEP